MHEEAHADDAGLFSRDGGGGKHLSPTSRGPRAVLRVRVGLKFQAQGEGAQGVPGKPRNTPWAAPSFLPCSSVRVFGFIVFVVVFIVRGEKWGCFWGLSSLPTEMDREAHFLLRSMKCAAGKELSCASREIAEMKACPA